MLSDPAAVVPTLDLFYLSYQAVERTVKEVTEASSQVFGAAAQDGYIRAQLQNRKQMPKFDIK